MGDFPRTVEEKARKYMRVVLQGVFYVELEPVHKASCDIRIKPKPEKNSGGGWLPIHVKARYADRPSGMAPPDKISTGDKTPAL